MATCSDLSAPPPGPGRRPPAPVTPRRPAWACSSACWAVASCSSARSCPGRGSPAPSAVCGENACVLPPHRCVGGGRQYMLRANTLGTVLSLKLPRPIQEVSAWSPSSRWQILHPATHFRMQQANRRWPTWPATVATKPDDPSITGEREIKTVAMPRGPHGRFCRSWAATSCAFSSSNAWRLSSCSFARRPSASSS